MRAGRAFRAVSARGHERRTDTDFPHARRDRSRRRCCLHAAAVAATERPAVAITDVSIVDVEHGASSAPRTVLIADGRIAAIDAPSEVRDSRTGRACRWPRSVPDAGARGHACPSLQQLLAPAAEHVVVSALHRQRCHRRARDGSAAGLDRDREGMARAIANGSLIAPRILAAGVVVDGDLRPGKRRIRSMLPPMPAPISSRCSRRFPSRTGARCSMRRSAARCRSWAMCRPASPR